jgi:hypothetical protein
MERYTTVIGIVALAVIFGMIAYGGFVSEQSRIDCKKHMATTTQRTAEEIVRICR